MEQGGSANSSAWIGGTANKCYACGRCSRCCICHKCPCCGQRFYDITITYGPAFGGTTFTAAPSACEHK